MPVLEPKASISIPSCWSIETKRLQSGAFLSAIEGGVLAELETAAGEQDRAGCGCRGSWRCRGCCRRAPWCRRGAARLLLLLALELVDQTAEDPELLGFDESELGDLVRLLAVVGEVVVIDGDARDRAARRWRLAGRW